MENQITKGKWQVNETGKTVLPNGTDTSQVYTISTTKDFYQKSIAKISAQSINDEKGLNKVLYSNETCLANAQLIAEAGNVTQETGKPPRRLADENKMLLEALKGLLDGINPSDARRGRFAHFWPEETNEHKAALTKAYVGSKGIPSDEQIVTAIEAINKATK